MKWNQGSSFAKAGDEAIKPLVDHWSYDFSLWDTAEAGVGHVPDKRCHSKVQRGVSPQTTV